MSHKKFNARRVSKHLFDVLDVDTQKQVRALVMAEFSDTYYLLLSMDYPPAHSEQKYIELCTFVRKDEFDVGDDFDMTQLALVGLANVIQDVASKQQPQYVRGEPLAKDSTLSASFDVTFGNSTELDTSFSYLFSNTIAFETLCVSEPQASHRLMTYIRDRMGVTPPLAIGLLRRGTQPFLSLRTEFDFLTGDHAISAPEHQVMH